MNILIIKLTPIYGMNSSMMRTLALTKGLLGNGNSIDFLTVPSSESHTLSKGYDFLSKTNIIETSKNKSYSVIVKDINQKPLKKMLYSKMRRMYHKLSVFDYSKSIAEKLKIEDLPKKEYDIVISVSDPKTSHIAAKRLINQGLDYKKWVQYWGDPLTLDITKKNIYPKIINKYIESNLLSNADLILYASPITLRKQKALFDKQANSMDFIPTPYIEKKYYPRTNNTKLQVGYFGDYIETTRNIHPLYEAAQKLEDKLDLTIVGFSDLTLQSKENIMIHERQDIEKFEINTDIMVCILNKKGTQIPGKLFHYASTNKAILLIIDGEYGKEISDYFSQFKRYYICENKTKEIIKTIDYISENLKKEKPLEDFHPQNIATKILSKL
ncbi:hypothetical protein [Ruoffia sp. FAM 26254]|uniref:hypothetical protein n=1 Tax=Ruoffia sp. FAM 26254 TaxID=3259518 RepID=UPI003885B01D